MRMQRLAIVLTVINLAMFAFNFAGGLPSTRVATATPQTGSPPTQDVAPVLRGRTLEIVDERGQVRSSIKADSNGEVVFRLIDRNGTIRVKLGADESGSGLLLLDEATEPGAHLIARRSGTSVNPKTTSLTLRSADGRERVLTP